MNDTTNTTPAADFNATARADAQALRDTAADREAERRALKGQMAVLEAQRKALAELPGEANELVTRLTAQLDQQRSRFLNDLRVSASQGRAIDVNFGSPAASAYLLHAMWLDALPKLALSFTGKSSLDSAQRSSQMAELNRKVILTQARLAHLGG